MYDFFSSTLATLLVTLDPPGLAPIFIGLTLGMTKAAQREVALRGTIIAFAILAAFAFGGGAVMAALGISIPAFRIAGGLLLFYIAFDMIFELRAQRKRELASDAMTIDHIRNVAAFPLAIPLMSGPGSITATPRPPLPVKRSETGRGKEWGPRIGGDRRDSRRGPHSVLLPALRGEEALAPRHVLKRTPLQTKKITAAARSILENAPCKGA
jgi:hypothetical protein